MGQNFLKRESAESILNLQLEWIRSADAKVPPIFAINLAMLGLIFIQASQHDNWSNLLLVLNISLAILTLSLSTVCLAMAVFPRITGPQGSLIFFGGITKRDMNSFIQEINELDEEVFVKDLLSQAYKNAEIAQNKFVYIKRAMILLFISIVPWFISIIFFYA